MTVSETDRDTAASTLPPRNDRDTHTAAQDRPWWKILTSLVEPWAIVFCVWRFGIYWTVILLAATYVASVLVVTGLMIGESRGS